MDMVSRTETYSKVVYGWNSGRMGRIVHVASVNVYKC